MVDYERMGQLYSDKLKKDEQDRIDAQKAASDKARAQLEAAQATITQVVIPEFTKAKDGLAKSGYTVVFDTAKSQNYEVAAAINIAKGHQFLGYAHQLQIIGDGFQIISFIVINRNPLEPSDPRKSPVDVTKNLFGFTGKEPINETLVGSIIETLMSFHR